jgi:hypothetical protein
VAEHPLCLYALSTEAHAPGNKGLLIGQKKPLEPKHVWSIRVRLEIAQRRWGKVALSRRRLFPCVFGELRKRLLERHFSPAGFEPVLADGLSQSFSNDPDVERRIASERSPAIARISDLT